MIDKLTFTLALTLWFSEWAVYSDGYFHRQNTKYVFFNYGQFHKSWHLVHGSVLIKWLRVMKKPNGLFCEAIYYGVRRGGRAINTKFLYTNVYSARMVSVRFVRPVQGSEQNKKGTADLKA